MKCPKCNSEKIKEEVYMKTTNKLKRGVHAVGAGVLGAAGLFLVTVPGLQHWGIASWGAACAIGNHMPDKEEHIHKHKYKCEECGNKWKI